MSIIDSQFTRRFAPTCIDPNKLTDEVKAQMKAAGVMPISVVLVDRVKEQVNKEITKHQLYHGPQGLGKSTVARVKIGLDINNKPVAWRDYEPLYVNCSKDANIDNLRNKIENFCTVSSFSDDGKVRRKIVFFDEIDGVRSEAFFDALRGFMDVYEKSVTFIATCNYINRVPGPIKSRFEPCINFAPINEVESKELLDKTKKRLNTLWTGSPKSGMLGRTATEEAIHLLAVRNGLDIRAALKAMQVLSENTTGQLNADNIVSGMSSFSEFYEWLFTKPVEELIHKEINIKYADKGYEIMQDMHLNLVEFVIAKHPEQKKLIGPINILCAKYINAMGNGVDPLLAFKACVYEFVAINK